MAEYLLEMKKISKAFPGVKALDEVDFAVKPSSVHALMGENGAGKSTLMKCLFGIYYEDSGEVLIEGKKVNFRNSKQALEHGVAMVHQELNQVLKRNVMENIWLGRFPLRFGMVDHKKMFHDTKKIFDGLGINVNPKQRLSTLPVSQRQMVEIAKAVSYQSQIIVFDEPTSSLTEPEAEHLFEIIATLKARGCGIVYISHKMEEILRIADYVTVLRDGKWVSTEPAENMTMDIIIQQMVGRELTNRFPPKTNNPGEVIVSVEGLASEYANLKEASFDLKQGEILGLAGLDGSGRTEVLENLFGIATRKSGKIIMRGKKITNKSAKQSIKNGFALVTEERRATGIFGILDVRQNIVISNLRSYRKGPLLSGKRMGLDTDKYIKALKVKTPNQRTKIKSLSGGNQQKVIFGRWLLTTPEVLLLDEPTRGIDVGAKYDIYQLMIELADAGKSIVMVSSEMPELLGVCDRIVVMSGGQVAGEVTVADTTQEEIMALAAKFA